MQHVIIIKDVDKRFLTIGYELLNSLKSYFECLMRTENPKEFQNQTAESRVQEFARLDKGVEKALRKRNIGNSMKPDLIPIGPWERLESQGIEIPTTF